MLGRCQSAARPACSVVVRALTQPPHSIAATCDASPPAGPVPSGAAGPRDRKPPAAARSCRCAERRLAGPASRRAPGRRRNPPRRRYRPPGRRRVPPCPDPPDPPVLSARRHPTRAEVDRNASLPVRSAWPDPSARCAPRGLRRGKRYYQRTSVSVTVACPSQQPCHNLLRSPVPGPTARARPRPGTSGTGPAPHAGRRSSSALTCSSSALSRLLAGQRRERVEGAALVQVDERQPAVLVVGEGRPASRAAAGRSRCRPASCSPRAGR